MLSVLEGMEMMIVTRMAAMITCHKHCWKLTMTLLLMMRTSLMSSVHLKKHLKVMQGLCCWVGLHKFVKTPKKRSLNS